MATCHDARCTPSVNSKALLLVLVKPIRRQIVHTPVSQFQCCLYCTHFCTAPLSSGSLICRNNSWRNPTSGLWLLVCTGIKGAPAATSTRGCANIIQPRDVDSGHCTTTPLFLESSLMNRHANEWCVLYWKKFVHVTAGNRALPQRTRISPNRAWTWPTLGKMLKVFYDGDIVIYFPRLTLMSVNVINDSTTMKLPHPHYFVYYSAFAFICIPISAEIF